MCTLLVNLYYKISVIKPICNTFQVEHIFINPESSQQIQNGDV